VAAAALKAVWHGGVVTEMPSTVMVAETGLREESGSGSGMQLWLLSWQ
jgi:hypothetical protein